MDVSVGYLAAVTVHGISLTVMFEADLNVDRG